jgi:hypothetical protein
MRLRLVVFVLLGVALAGAGVAWVFYAQRGAHLVLQGSVSKVRTVATDENSSVAIVDFRFVNVADYLWMVRKVDVSVTDAQGYTVPGSTVSEVDAARLFEYFPLLGQKYNDSLIARTRLEPHRTLDRMIAAKFEIPEAQLQARKGLRIRIEDVDGAVSEIAEGASQP